MAIYRSANGNVSTHDDDKLGFDWGTYGLYV